MTRIQPVRFRIRMACHVEVPPETASSATFAAVPKAAPQAMIFIGLHTYRVGFPNTEKAASQKKDSIKSRLAIRPRIGMASAVQTRESRTTQVARQAHPRTRG